jgi:chitinase
MKKITIIPLIVSAMILAMSSAFADTILFSPYADITLNVHWNDQYQDLEPMDLVKISKESGIKSFHFAFITDSGSCNPAWGGQVSYGVNTGWGSRLTDDLRLNKIDYTISFGGAVGQDLSQACNVSQLTAVYENIIQLYKPRGLDFATIMTALTHIQAAHPDLNISFTLPVLPQGLISTGEDVLRQAAAAKLHYTVNIMAMDYGDGYNNDMGQYAIQASSSLFEFLKGLYPLALDEDLWKMIEVTPMIGLNDVSIEKFTLDNVDALRQFAMSKHLGGLHMWSLSRDKPCADLSASNICSGNMLQKNDYDFSMHFMGL